MWVSRSPTKLLEEIYVSRLEKLIKSEVESLGGPTKTCELLDVKYTHLKEWLSGRRPISIFLLKEILKLGRNKEKADKFIATKNYYLSCRYSPHKIKFPKEITKELAYIVGIILGDGTLKGEAGNKRGDWTIGAYFDNEEHCKLYVKYFNKVFETTPKYRLTKSCCLACSIASKALFWFLQKFFEIKNGYKHDSIIIPKLIEYQNEEVLSWFIQGLFDSDGTVIPSTKTIKLASTSQKIIQQTKKHFDEFGIASNCYKWNKKGNFKTLHTLRVCSKKSIATFANKIGFQHPIKKEKLKNLCNSISYDSPVF